jgi:hypothetical protein
MNRLEKMVLGMAFAAMAAPAFAGGAQPAPAPIAGLGIGAIALVGLGYRALKNRIRD